jgi:hypothetical protein
MKKKWFWTTLAFWGVFSSAIICRALIFTPLQFDPQTIHRFSTQINGLPQEHTLWVNLGPLNRLIPLIETQYQKQGWNPVGSGFDFAPAALGIQDPSFALPDSFQIKLFERNGETRTLGLWQSPQADQTYGWACDTPQAVQDFAQARKNWDFPFLPPTNAISFYAEKLKNFQVAIITLPVSSHPEEQFDEICRSQAFSKSPYANDAQSASFILRKNNRRLLAQVISGRTQTSFSFVNLNQ